MIDRRAFLSAAGAGLGAAFLAADPVQLNASFNRAAEAALALRRGSPPPPLEVLTPEQAADVEAIAAQIIPTDDLPGAREARVVNFVDHGLATWAQGQRRATIDGLAQFNAALSGRYQGVQRFTQLSPAQQLEFLQANEQSPFFQQMIFVTLAGTFSYPDWGGNYGKAGWRILGFQDSYAWQPPFGWYDARANGGPN
jgi:gluconate 2-dehydrogenase gamma chain